MPTTDATAFWGNASDTVVNRLAAQPWCPNVATLIKATATPMPGARTAAAPIGMHSAHSAMAAFRERPGAQPRRIKYPEIHPPRTLPTSAARYTTTRAQLLFWGATL